MGDLTWYLSALLGTGGLGFLVRWIVRREREYSQERIAREREITASWRAVAERQDEVLYRILSIVESSPWLVTVPAPQVDWRGSSPESSDSARWTTSNYDVIRPSRHARRPPP